MLQFLKIMLEGKKATVQGRIDEGGATGVEYGLLVALIAAVIVVVVATLGGKVATAFSKVNNALP
jgi:pilus assembly protein Flp/PilA